MLTENQAIIYRKNGEEISRITAENEKDIALAPYIRHTQPFIKEGGILNIPENVKGRVTRTSRIQDVQREENTLIVKTLNSTYEVEYKNIDLEKVLADGKFQGVNAENREKIPGFPGVN